MDDGAAIASKMVCLELSATPTGDISSAAASAAGAIRARFASHCPTKITIEQSMCLGICAIVANSKPVIEFIFDRVVSRIACSKLPSFELNGAEWCAIVARCCASRPNEMMLKVATAMDFRERVAAVEDALRCTLSESGNKRAWAQSLQTRVVAVLCFQTSEPPYQALDAIFGSVVRSDLRKCEDLHSSQHDRPMDIITLATMVESVAHAVLY